MRLIGINGLKRSGKDTTYQFVKELLPGMRVERAAFADKLKIIAAKALGFDRADEELIGLMDSFKDTGSIGVSYRESEQRDFEFDVLHGLTGREYLQYFGEHARNVFGDDFWVDHVLPRSNAYIPNWKHRHADVLCITDVRYVNEAFRIIELNGEVWHVKRPGLVSDGHATEQELPEEYITRVIDNSGDLDHLKQEVQRALND